MSTDPSKLGRDLNTDLAEQVGSGLVRASAEWVITSVNAAGEDVLGQARPSLVGKPVSGVLEGVGSVLAGLTAGSDHRPVIRAVLVRRDDRRVYVDVTIRPGAPTGWVLTLIDTTSAVAAEAETARLRLRLTESERARAKLTTLQEELTEQVPKDAGGAVMVGVSGALHRVREQIARVAPTSTTVLIHGETGSGKELVARSIHALSTRKGQAFVPVNCGAIPETLIESEMFGHEKGAFTGADKRRLGKFELADGGTLFLDEIAELPLQSQAKLLRVLQDGTFERVGGAETVRVSVRLVAATHRDLLQQVERGRFREDLYYRLNVFKIEVPPLRARKEDLKALAEHLHERVARSMARGVLPLSERSVRRILAYHWPGNVRELANAIERATLLADGPELEVELPEAPRMGESGKAGAPWAAGNVGGPGERAEPTTQTTDVLLDLTLEQLQRLHITHSLERCGHRVFGAGGAAQRLDINPRTLLSRMDKYGIIRPREARRGTTPDGAGESP